MALVNLFHEPLDPSIPIPNTGPHSYCGHTPADLHTEPTLGLCEQNILLNLVIRVTVTLPFITQESPLFAAATARKYKRFFNFKGENS